MNTETVQKGFRCGYVAIVGRPNVGKSTMMNALLGEKLAIVSPRPQTTRHRIIGILNRDDCQIIFLDTPGIIVPKYPLQEAMVRTAHKTMGSADLILFMIEAIGITPEDEEIFKSLEDYKAPKFILINKIDLLPKAGLLPLIDALNKRAVFKEIIPVSALKKDGLDLLVKLLLELLPGSPPLFPRDQISDGPERFFVSEMIREQIFYLYGEEIPYSATVRIETFKEREGRPDFIRAAILVERDSQKGILIGKGGQSLKKLGQRSREHIERFLGRPVYLELIVQVSKNWRKDIRIIRDMGYS